MARGDPYIRIINQPTNRMRFRYGSEKGSHGALTGKDSSHKRKTFPTVQLENYFGNKTVYVKATLHTNSEPPVQHVHRLRGPDCTDGVCIKKVDKTSIVVFQNLSIEFVGKRELSNIIYERKQKELQFQLCDEVIRDLANEESKRINLHVVRICFEAGIFEEGAQWQSLCKTYSDPIANQKSTDTGELKITRIDKYSGSCKGGDEVFLLCERVNKKDIKIKFFEEKDGESRWEAEADFTDSDVHHQVAIVFKTPPYRNIDINQSVEVRVQLFRPSDNETSKSIPFEYEPALKDTTSYDLSKKKRKTSHTDFEPLSTVTSLSPRPVNTTNINYEKEKGNNNEGGERKNIEKSVLTCIELNSEPVFKAFPSWSSNNSVQINMLKKQNSLNSIERVTDFKSVREKEDPNLQNILHSTNNNYENDFYDISKFLDDICMQDESPYFSEDTKNNKLIDFSRDPVLGSTSNNDITGAALVLAGLLPLPLVVSILKIHPAYMIGLDWDVSEPTGTGVEIYTDGSKDGSLVGTAYCVLSDGVEVYYQSVRLNEEASVFQAELVTLEGASQWILSLLGPEPVTVYSDSQSSLQALSDRYHHDPLVQEIRDGVLRVRHVVLRWI
ncbi:nuclear factor NF-kappa-B p110 subunit-like [Centruroides sculpturatus]|uniref:nuclear factor NF-kappa-B p110 subunit-like n=1 Tax=Centruroides sculpturatus TaxID=218467 RepID=UPI000C6D38C5|nr:nuclear factor NF-kappa-B p110 subunit-like [Centruroides sculpturatus]